MFVYRPDNNGIVDVLGRFAIGQSTCEVRKVGSKIRLDFVYLTIIIHSWTRVKFIILAGNQGILKYTMFRCFAV